jgi:molybdenum cofactor cytidylyltransferase
MIPGAVLAAGWSTRMGRSKALLRAGLDGPTFVETSVTTLRDAGLDDLLVVGRVEDEPLRSAVGALDGVRFADNRHAAEGQISSIVTAINVIDHPGVRGLLVLPVDQPLVRPSTVAELVARFSESRALIARACYTGRAGHPAIFDRRVFDELRQADRSLGAKAVLQRHRASILEVDTDDEGVVIDIDDPDTYQRIFGVLPE